MKLIERLAYGFFAASGIFVAPNKAPATFRKVFHLDTFEKTLDAPVTPSAAIVPAYSLPEHSTTTALWDMISTPPESTGISLSPSDPVDPAHALRGHSAITVLLEEATAATGFDSISPTPSASIEFAEASRDLDATTALWRPFAGDMLSSTPSAPPERTGNVLYDKRTRRGPISINAAKGTSSGILDRVAGRVTGGFWDACGCLFPYPVLALLLLASAYAILHYFLHIRDLKQKLVGKHEQGVRMLCKIAVGVLRIARLEKDAAASKTTIQVLEDDVTYEKRRASKAEAANQVLREKHAWCKWVEKQHDIWQWYTLMDKVKISRVKEEAAEWKTAHDLMAMEINPLTQSMRAKDRLIDMLGTTAIGNEWKLYDMENEVAEKDRLLKAKDKTIKMSEKDAAASRRALKKLIEKSAGQDRMLIMKNNTIDSLEKDAADHKRALQITSEKSAEKDRRLFQKEWLIAELEKNAAASMHSLQSTKEERDEKERLLLEGKDTIEGLREKLKQLADSGQEKDKAIAGYKDKDKGNDSKITELQEKVASLEKSLQAKNESIADEKKKAAECTAGAQALVVLNTALKASVEAKDDVIANEKKTVADIKAQFEKLQEAVAKKQEEDAQKLVNLQTACDNFCMMLVDCRQAMLKSRQECLCGAAPPAQPGDDDHEGDWPDFYGTDDDDPARGDHDGGKNPEDRARPSSDEHGDQHTGGDSAPATSSPGGGNGENPEDGANLAGVGLGDTAGSNYTPATGGHAGDETQEDGEAGDNGEDGEDGEDGEGDWFDVYGTGDDVLAPGIHSNEENPEDVVGSSSDGRGDHGAGGDTAADAPDHNNEQTPEDGVSPTGDGQKQQGPGGNTTAHGDDGDGETHGNRVDFSNSGTGDQSTGDCGEAAIDHGDDETGKDRGKSSNGDQRDDSACDEAPTATDHGEDNTSGKGAGSSSDGPAVNGVSDDASAPSSHEDGETPKDDAGSAIDGQGNNANGASASAPTSHGDGETPEDGATPEDGKDLEDGEIREDDGGSSTAPTTSNSPNPTAPATGVGAPIDPAQVAAQVATLKRTLPLLGITGTPSIGSTAAPPAPLPPTQPSGSAPTPFFPATSTAGASAPSYSTSVADMLAGLASRFPPKPVVPLLGMAGTPSIGSTAAPPTSFPPTQPFSQAPAFHLPGLGSKISLRGNGKPSFGALRKRRMVVCGNPNGCGYRQNARFTECNRCKYRAPGPQDSVQGEQGASDNAPAPRSPEDNGTPDNSAAVQKGDPADESDEEL